MFQIYVFSDSLKMRKSSTVKFTEGENIETGNIIKLKKNISFSNNTSNQLIWFKF